jgi:UDP-glucose 4-epimerase
MLLASNLDRTVAHDTDPRTATTGRLRSPRECTHRGRRRVHRCHGGSACLDSGITPIILDNFSTGRAEFVRDRIFYPGDIADGPLVDKIFADHPDIGAVVHMAAMIVVPESVVHPLRYYRENVARTVEFTEHVVTNGGTRFLFSSSASIYRPGEDLSVDENSPPDPPSPYARTKAMVEQMLADGIRDSIRWAAIGPQRLGA